MATVYCETATIDWLPRDFWQEGLARGDLENTAELAQTAPRPRLREHCAPSYNTATSGCENNGQWQRPLEVVAGILQRAR